MFASFAYQLHNPSEFSDSHPSPCQQKCPILFPLPNLFSDLCYTSLPLKFTPLPTQLWKKTALFGDVYFYILAPFIPTEPYEGFEADLDEIL